VSMTPIMVSDEEECWIRVLEIAWWGTFNPKSDSKKSHDRVVCNSSIGSGNTDTTPSSPVSSP